MQGMSQKRVNTLRKKKEILYMTNINKALSNNN